jgi:hypothetical protein
MAAVYRISERPGEPRQQGLLLAAGHGFAVSAKYTAHPEPMVGYPQVTTRGGGGMIPSPGQNISVLKKHLDEKI